MTFPVRDRIFEGFLFNREEPGVMVYYRITEDLAYKTAVLEIQLCCRKMLWNSGEMRSGIYVSSEVLVRFDAVGNAVHALSDGGGNGQIRVAIGSRDAAFDTKAAPLADNPETGRARGVPPGRPVADHIRL